MTEAVLGLGANLGSRRAIFAAACALLEARGCSVIARSPLYETPPLGPPQPDYLNGALRVYWDRELEELLAITQEIERALGRERREKWGARTLDIDLLYWSDGPVECAELVVPHRELEARAFALAPLLDVAPGLLDRYAEVLAALGGAPALAEPSWVELGVDDGRFCTAWLRDRVELAAQVATLIAWLREPEARTEEVRPFEVAGDIGDGRKHAWIDDAFAGAPDLAVAAVVITSVANGRISGVLTGMARAPGALVQVGSWPPLAVNVEARPSGERRVCVRALAR